MEAPYPNSGNCTETRCRAISGVMAISDAHSLSMTHPPQRTGNRHFSPWTIWRCARDDLFNLQRHRPPGGFSDLLYRGPGGHHFHYIFRPMDNFDIHIDHRVRMERICFSLHPLQG